MSVLRALGLLLLATALVGVLGVDEGFCARVAVIDFESIGDDPNIGRGVTEIVRTELIKTGKYEVVERALLNKVLEEQRFQISDLVDPSKAVELGKILGADLILTGSVVKIGTSYTINARFIDVKTGAAKRAEAIRGNEINELTYMSSQLIGILEQQVEGAAAPPTKRPEAPPATARSARVPMAGEGQQQPYVGMPLRPGTRAGPSLDGTFSLGGGTFSMEEVNDGVDEANLLLGSDLGHIEGGLSLALTGGVMATDKVGVGLRLWYLKGASSGEYWSGWDYDQIEIEATGVGFALHALYRLHPTQDKALYLGGDLGGIRLAYSTYLEYAGVGEEVDASGSGPLIGVFAGGELALGRLLLQGELGFRSAKGTVEAGDVGGELELDFSGPYVHLTAGVRISLL